MGIEERNIIIPEQGLQVEINKNYFRATGTVPAGERLIDGTGFGDLESVVIRDRKLLSEEGMCIVIVNKYSRGEEVFGTPTLISRGFIYQDEASEIITEAKEVIANGLANIDAKAMDSNELKQSIKKIAANFFFKKTKRKPMIITIINEQ
jgi:ribonuclease J